MITKARIENDVVVEVLTADPFPPFHPSLIWMVAPPQCVPGWAVINGAVQPAPEPATPALTFAEQQAAMIREADLIAKRKRDAITADYSAAEMASWPIKRAEALAWQASGDNADAPNLTAEAVARQATVASLVARVIDKANQLAQLEAVIAGYTGYLHDQIRAVAAEDRSALDAIDLQGGWPA